MLRFRVARCHAADLMLVGVGTLTIDQRIGRLNVPMGRDGLAQDWRAVGGDMNRAMGRMRRGKPAA